ALRTTDEMFATLDLAVINLHNASVRFLKIGSTPSFIKRGDQMLNVEGSNLPMGIIQEFDVDIVSDRLKAEDLLIMMSDGIFEGPKHIENMDAWLKQRISNMATDDPQEVADLLLEEVIRTRSGEIEDDMTVLCAKIVKTTPKWSSIPVYAEEAQSQLRIGWLFGLLSRSTDLNSATDRQGSVFDQEIATTDRQGRMYDREIVTIDRHTIRKVAPSIGNIIHRLINGTTDRKWQAPARSIRKSQQNLFLLPNEPTTFTCIHSQVPGENVEGIVGRFWCEEGNIETNIINYGWVLE